MATPKEKHLIELMIEAGVKWPDGAEYAAQDKYDLNVNFYKNGKPNFKSCYLQWMANDCTFMSDDGIELDSLCRNWHQTIVTREQYAEAVEAANTSGETNQVRESEDVPDSHPAAQLYSGVAGVMPSESIEAMLAEIKAKREEHGVLVAKAEALALEISGIEKKANDKLKEYGFAMSPVAAPSKFVDKPWEIGDKCIVTDSPDSQQWVDLECVLSDLDEGDEHLRYHVKHQNKGEYWVAGIRRP